MINMRIKRNQAKILVPIISAYAEGRILQYKEKEVWRDIEDSEGLSINTIIKEAENYRIKPEVKYRPFKDAEECWQEMLKHHPFGWVINKNTGRKYCITAIHETSNEIFGDTWKDLHKIRRNYTFADGTPFGVKMEE